MNLTQAKVVGETRAITVLSGRITEIFKDRRESSSPIRIGDAARRRKVPSDLEPLIGTGQLWVVFGHFEVRSKDVENWGKTAEMFIVVHNMSFRITKLAPHRLDLHPRRPSERQPEILSWKFSALVQLKPDQLERIQSEITNRGYYDT